MLASWCECECECVSVHWPCLGTHQLDDRRSKCIRFPFRQDPPINHVGQELPNAGQAPQGPMGRPGAEPPSTPDQIDYAPAAAPLPVL